MRSGMRDVLSYVLYEGGVEKRRANARSKHEKEFLA